MVRFHKNFDNYQENKHLLEKEEERKELLFCVNQTPQQYKGNKDLFQCQVKIFQQHKSKMLHYLQMGGLYKFKPTINFTRVRIPQHLVNSFKVTSLKTFHNFH